MAQPSLNANNAGSQGANAYLRTRVLTASPEQLRLMLLEGAVRFARAGREGLTVKNFEQSYDGFSKCRNILIELMNSMRPEVYPDLCQRVNALYTFLYVHLTEASLEKDAKKADEVIELLEYEKQTWLLLMDKVAGERGGAATVATTKAVPATAGAGAGGVGSLQPRSSLSVQG
jgi:flagellar protein FliS